MSLPSHMSTLGSLKPSQAVVTSVPAADWAESDSDSPSFIANKPTAMRSPAALSFGQKTYDGSAAATVTAADLGALTAHQDISGKVDSSALFSGGKVKPELLPSYVDDVLEYPSLVGFPSTGEAGKIYVAKDTNKTYRWSGTQYVEVSPAPTVDSALSGSSENPVQNKVVTSALNGKATAAQGAKADAALSRAEAVAGFTDWVWGDGVNRGQPAWDAENNQWSLNGGTYVSHSAVSSEDDVVLPTLYTIEEDEPMPWTATRTRLPTMADIPTDNAQLTNGAGYATTTAMNTALAGKADASSLPYALVVKEPTDRAYIPASAFPLTYYDLDGVQHTISSLSGVSIGKTSFDDDPNVIYEVTDADTNFVIGSFVDGTWGDASSSSWTSTPTLTITKTVTLDDRAINAVTLGSGVESVVFRFPAKTQGKARDFMLRLVITGSTVPEIGFVESDGTTEVAFDADDDSWADIEQGVNLLMFTDTQEASA